MGTSPLSPPTDPPTGRRPAPPFDPIRFQRLLDHDPLRGGAILAAMRPAMRYAQAAHHAERRNLPVAAILVEWVVRIASSELRDMQPDHDRDPLGESVFAPSMLAALHPNDVCRLIGMLTEPQQVTQACAQSRWLNTFGFHTIWLDFLYAWREE